MKAIRDLAMAGLRQWPDQSVFVLVTHPGDIHEAHWADCVARDGLDIPPDCEVRVVPMSDLPERIREEYEEVEA